MGIFKAISGGLGTTFRKPRLVVILYVVNLAFALAAAAPFLAIVQKELGHSLAGLSVQPVDPMWIGEAVLGYGRAFPALLAGFVVLGLLYLVLHVFLNGGIVGRLLDREAPASLAAFSADCGRLFWRYVRLFLLSLVFYALTLGVVLKLVSVLFRPISDGAVTEWTPLILSNIHLLIALLLLSVVHMIVDYARIAVVADEERRVLKALRHALTFLKARFFRAWALYLLLVLGTLAGAAVFYAVLKPLGAPGVGLVVAGFFWMQIYVVFRIWTRTLFIAAQAEFYRSHPY
ncbi:MAG TPA: hypothetical protein P5119_07555 [Candidatus Aminicenantes bacterium]|nr:hypothetical protein [Candidatus Aminicenantes bacterium]HRY65184.1 hypothetical protein [Candidatus Aminicenantes bacterium]HRZ72348.1 hypothetical protein [Candidatus Aminicenantes bacterium]